MTKEPRAPWKPIETAPRKIVVRYEGATKGYFAEYGEYILVYTGSVQRARWWQSSDEPERYCNFIADGGQACHPTHWMPLPKPPAR